MGGKRKGEGGGRGKGGRRRRPGEAKKKKKASVMQLGRSRGQTRKMWKDGDSVVKGGEKVGEKKKRTGETMGKGGKAEEVV